MGGDRLPEFLETGIYRFESSNTVFIDPVRVLNRYYTRFRVSPSTYYTRSFTSKASSNPKKRRRNQKQKPRVLNERELASDQRHQLVRPMLMKSHECLMGAADLLEVMRGLNVSSVKDGDLKSGSGDDISFVELGQVWQAPLYEVTVNLWEDPLVEQSERQRVVPLFNSLVVNNTRVDVEAEILHRKYVMPRNSCFFMPDLAEIHNLVPAGSDSGFNLIVLDPPWENASAQQKLLYPTLPNRYFLSVPIKQLTHKDGALVALWVTNREKLRDFVERELFPAWGVSYAASLYWLKVKEDGSLISDLDLFHHRPYECLMLGYSYSEDRDPGKPAFGKSIIDIQTIISIPGDYSRKPPIGELLMGDAPGCKPARCIELFSREMMAGWTSWGNEPLHFQNSSYFLKK